MRYHQVFPSATRKPCARQVTWMVAPPGTWLGARVASVRIVSEGVGRTAGGLSAGVARTRATAASGFGGAVGHRIVDERGSDQAAGSGPVVVEGVGGDVVVAVPGAAANLIPPGVAVCDLEPCELAGDEDCLAAGHVWPLGPAGVAVVGPGVGDASAGLVDSARRGGGRIRSPR
jgi:hypothetical protein